MLVAERYKRAFDSTLLHQLLSSARRFPTSSPQRARLHPTTPRCLTVDPPTIPLVVLDHAMEVQHLAACCLRTALAPCLGWVAGLVLEPWLVAGLVLEPRTAAGLVLEPCPVPTSAALVNFRGLK
uniref:Uncharacterized protein n=1 Tax=Sphaerodactylus townsendi TaxID=933632 RepID=A0ACB8G772_9SAUR